MAAAWNYNTDPYEESDLEEENHLGGYVYSLGWGDGAYGDRGLLLRFYVAVGLVVFGEVWVKEPEYEQRDSQSNPEY